MSSATFETTYTKYSFAPLVELGLLIGEFVKARIERTSDRDDAGHVHGLSA